MVRSRHHAKNQVPCPDPAQCQVDSHTWGSRAMYACTARFGARYAAPSTAPPSALVTDDWAEGDGAHPLGGYDAMSIGPDPRGGGRVRTYTLDGQLHRNDGPAVDGRDRDSYPTQQWRIAGQLHRGDGPADVSRSYGGPSYHWRGRRLEGARADVEADIAALIAAGADPKVVVGWASIERGVALELLSAGAEVEACAQAWAAGVREVDALAAVGRGEMPLSWAAAGR